MIESVDVFFYGLFMDADVLRSHGASPRRGRAAFVADHVVQLRTKAILLRAAGERAYGMVYSLTRREMQALYRNVQGYEEQLVTAHLRDGTGIAAASMVHRSPPLSTPIDPKYAAQWTAILMRLGLPF